MPTTNPNTLPRSERLLLTKSGHLQVFDYGPPRRRSGIFLVIPNGYGVLPYVHSVAESLTRLGYQTHSFNSYGQGNSTGELSLASGAQACKEILSDLESLYEVEKIKILAHCSAMLYLLNLPLSHRVWECVDRVILYSYLSTPELHLPRFFRKARKHGVRVSKELGNLDFTCEEYACLPVPFALIHGRTALNSVRASRDEVANLERVAKPYLVARPPRGYEISADEQVELTNLIAEQFIHPAAMTQCEKLV